MVFSGALMGIDDSPDIQDLNANELDRVDTDLSDVAGEANSPVHLLNVDSTCSESDEAFPDTQLNMKPISILSANGLMGIKTKELRGENA